MSAPTSTTGHGRLDGEIALVTGATTGIGRAIVRRFAAEGARVVVTGRNEARGAEVVAAIAGDGGRAWFHAADLEHEGVCMDLVAWVVEELGGLTVLVNNAAPTDVSHDGPVDEMDTSFWEHMFAVNVMAAAWLSREAIGAMRDAGHGSIVNISSRAAVRGTPRLAAYTASKGALNALTRSIAVDYAAEGIRCNAISPGYILDDGRDANLTPARRAELEARHLTRLGTAQDVAHAAVYLASEESGFVTGIELPLDGGASIARAASFG